MNKQTNSIASVISFPWPSYRSNSRSAICTCSLVAILDQPRYEGFSLDKGRKNRNEVGGKGKLRMRISFGLYYTTNSNFYSTEECVV